MSKASRSKGARGQTLAKHLLLERGYGIDTLSAGLATADLIATDRCGNTWCVEVKNCAGILPAHKRQAMAQAKARRLPWMLLSKIAGSSSWLVQRQGQPAEVWHQATESDDPGAPENGTA